MKAICIGYPGAESVMQKEIKEKLKVASEIEPSVALFESDEKSICKLAYLGQSFTHILFFLGSFKINMLADSKSAEKLDYSLLKNKTFRVNCMRLGKHDFNSQDLAVELGKIIAEKSGSEPELKNPDFIIFAYLFKDTCYLGIDIAGIELDKRDYNVHPHRSAIKGTLAFTLLMLAGYDEKKILLDPFCLSGAVAIEAAYYKSGFSVNHYRKKKLKFLHMGIVDEKYLEQIDKEGEKRSKKQKEKTIYAFDADLRSIRASEQNAKIGGVDRYIEFARMDPKWIDMKFEKGSVDLIVSSPATISRWIVKDAKKSYGEMFNQADTLLKKDGKIVVISNKLLEEAASGSKFVKEKSYSIQKRKEVVGISIFKRP
ncbi:methyltransferase [Candidatus Woesearchaeota archaeon]|nr:methyltransferase [Candidatus Woesearchaeota archaeon]MBW3014299.1 methyltransferase [Candidatus Woesearchaeota archaeon]